MEVRAVRNGEFFDAGRHYRYLAPASAEEERISVRLMSGADNLRGVHCHDCLELYIVMAGHGTFFDRKVRREVTPGDLFLVPPGEFHGFVGQEGLSAAAVLWSERAMTMPLTDLEETEGYRRIFAPGSPGSAHLDNAKLAETELLLRRLDGEIRSGLPGNRLTSLCRLCLLLAHICRSAGGAAVSENRKLRHLDKAIAYMNAHYARPVSRGQLARAANMSESSFYREFRRVFGQAPYAYLTGIRLRRAEELLLGTDMGMDEIAMRCGFSDGSYFVRLFRSRYSVTPLVYRRRSASAAGLPSPLNC